MKLHIDCNSYYASCEIATNPDLEGHPVVVANVNEAGGGVILALNTEAKRLGLRRGIPVFKAKALIEREGVVMCRADHVKYKKISRQIMDAVRRQDLVVDFIQYSVDEFFGEMPLTDAAEARYYINLIKDNIRVKTGIPVSCGYAETYTLAKVATYYAKHYAGYGGICVLRPENRGRALSLLPISEVWGIGRRYQKLLLEHGVTTALEFVQRPEEWVQQLFTVVGWRTYKELQGVPSIDLHRSGIQKSIMQSHTFGYMLTHRDELAVAVKGFVVRCAVALREQGGECGTVTVFLSTNRHRDDLAQYENSRMRKLRNRTADTLELCRVANELLEEVFRDGYQYKQAGVVLGDIRKCDGKQLDMFTVEEDEKRRRLMEVTDAINKKFGTDTRAFGKNS